MPVDAEDKDVIRIVRLTPFEVEPSRRQTYGPGKVFVAFPARQVKHPQTGHVRVKRPHLAIELVEEWSREELVGMLRTDLPQLKTETTVALDALAALDIIGEITVMRAGYVKNA